MSTRAVDSVKISQMPKLAVAPVSAELPIIVGSSNFSTTIAAIIKNVTKDTVGLSLVQNLAPLDMPISMATQAALDLKMDKDATVPISQVANLQTILNSKMDKDAMIPQSQVINLVTDLETLRTAPIPVSRISNFDPAVQAIIDRQPKPDFPVIQGAHSW